MSNINNIKALLDAYEKQDLDEACKYAETIQDLQENKISYVISDEDTQKLALLASKYILGITPVNQNFWNYKI